MRGMVFVGVGLVSLLGVVVGPSRDAVTSVFELAKSGSTATFGSIVVDGDSLFVASATPDARNLHALREVKLTKGGPAAERVLACPTGAITSIAVDGAHVVYAEAAKGVFSIVR
jgi:hypothetical protein